MLPQAYRDAVKILVDAGEAMRARQILAAMGQPDSASKREGLRSKLKRLVERGWLEGAEAGLFTVAAQVASEISGRGQSPGVASAGIVSSPPG